MCEFQGFTTNHANHTRARRSSVTHSPAASTTAVRWVIVCYLHIMRKESCLLRHVLYVHLSNPHHSIYVRITSHATFFILCHWFGDCVSAYWLSFDLLIQSVTMIMFTVLLCSLFGLCYQNMLTLISTYLCVKYSYQHFS